MRSYWGERIYQRHDGKKAAEMFTSQARIDSKTGPDNLGRFEYLQALVTEFQDTDKQGSAFSSGLELQQYTDQKLGKKLNKHLMTPTDNLLVSPKPKIPFLPSHRQSHRRRLTKLKKET